MLGFFRRALTSWFFLGLLGLILLAFVVTGVSGPRGYLSGNPNDAGDTVAVVGGRAISDRMVIDRAQSELHRVQQQQPDATMAQLVSSGGVEALVDQMIATTALDRFAERHGMIASPRLIDGEVASIPAFAGPTGQFDERQMQAVLGRQRITARAMRDDIGGDLLRRQLITPLAAPGVAPEGLARAYAALLLEERRGQVALVPLAKLAAVPAPTPAEVETFYATHLSRYSVGERRVLRYAAFDQSNAVTVAPSDAEVAAAYKADAAKYTASEVRTFSQVILPDEARARAFAAKVAGGQAFAAAAAAAGFQPTDTSLGSPAQAALAQTTSPAIAAAAFAAPVGGTTAPLKSELGWHIIHVDALKATPAQTLEQARPEIAAALAKKKGDDALTALSNKIQNSLDGGATFDDVVKANRLSVAVTAPLLADGSSADAPGVKPQPDVQPLLKPGFQASPEDAPTLETLVAGTRFALLRTAQILPAAPLPIAQIRDRVTRDLTIERISQRAQAVAQAILAKTRGGMPLAQAVATAGAGLPPPQPVTVRQIDLIQQRQQVPPAVQALFKLAPGKGQIVAAPGLGWFVVRLDSAVPGDVAKMPQVVSSTRAELGRGLSDELVRQFAAAAAQEVGIKRNAAAVARLKQALLSGAR